MSGIDIFELVQEGAKQYATVVKRAEGKSNPQDIDGVIAGITEAHEKTLTALKDYREFLSKQQAG
jgi:hypothetical protein